MTRPIKDGLASVSLWSSKHLEVDKVESARFGRDGSQITVAVVDSGVSGDHLDLSDCVDSPLSIFGNFVDDDDDHGTMLAGTIAVLTKQCLDSFGKPRVRILPVKFFSQSVFPNADLGAQAIELALTRRPQIILLSWDCGYNSPALEAALKKAGDNDALVIVAAGNHGMNNDLYPNWPANYSTMAHVISVMATTAPDSTFTKDRLPADYEDDDRAHSADYKGDDRAHFSNYGKTSVHVAAPGVGISSMIPYCKQAAGSPVPSFGSFDAGYRSYSGTSPASAHVAALAALIRAQNPGWDAIRVKRHLLASVESVNRLTGLCTTGGLIHFSRALFGPISDVKLKGALRPGADVDLTWVNKYESAECAELSAKLIGPDGRELHALNTAISNDTKSRARQSVKVKLPDQSITQVRVILSNSDGRLFGEPSTEFDIG